MARIFVYVMIIKTSMVVALENKSVYVNLGDTVEIRCPNLSRRSMITWFGPEFVYPISHGSTLYSQYNNPQRFRIIGNFSIGEYTLKIIGLRTTDLGTYKCLVSIENVSYQHDFVLILKRPPRDLRVANADDDVIRGIEGKEVKLECSVESGIPKETLTWIHKGIIVKESQTGRVKLLFIPKHLNHLDKYTCKANNDALHSPLQGTVTLMISYVPRVLLNKNETVQITEGSLLTIDSIIDSFPEARNVTWYKLTEYSKIVFVMQRALHFNVITRRDAGTYVCEATNEIGTGREDIKVVVLYVPDIKIQYENYTQEAQNRSLKCIPNGFPAVYTFYDWQHKSDFGDHIRFLKGTESGILMLPYNSVKSLRYQDNGYYSCSVSNGIKDSHGHSMRTEEILLDIKGEPVFVTDNIETIYSEYLKSVDIVTNIYSNPKYTQFIIEDGNGDRLKADDTIMKMTEENTFVNDVFHNVKVKVKGYKITLRILQLTHKNFQSYTVTVQNEFGQRKRQISIKYATTPGKPLNVSVFPLQNGALVSWIKNFNGGYKQHFYIQHRVSDLDGWKTTKSLNDSNDNQLSWVVNNLHAGHIYHFRMYSENSIGESNRTDEILITLENDSLKTVVYIVISSSTCAGIIAAVCIFLFRRFARGPTTLPIVESTGLEVEIGHYEEIEVNEMNENRQDEITFSPEINVDNRNEQSDDSNSTSESDNTDENNTDPKDLNVNFYQPLTHNQEQSQNNVSYDILT